MSLQISMVVSACVALCPKCSSVYSRNRTAGCHFPIILDCGHSLCQACISAEVLCVVCSQTAKPVSGRGGGTSFLPDYFALGVAMDVAMSSAASEQAGPEEPHDTAMGDADMTSVETSGELHKIRRTYKKLRVGRRNLNRTMSSAQTHLGSTKNEVDTMFHYLHSLLDMRREQLLNEVEQAHDEQMVQFRNTHEQVSELIDEMEQAFVKDQPVANAGIREKSQELLDRVSMLGNLDALMNNKEISNVKVNFENVSKNMFANIGSVVVDPIRTQTPIQSAQDSKSGMTCQQKLSVETKAMSPCCQVLAEAKDCPSVDIVKENGCPGKELNAKSSEHLSASLMRFTEALVYVSHVQDPGLFWVQFASDIEELKKLESDITFYCNSIEDVVTAVKAGAIYLAPLQLDKKWHRVRLQSMHLAGSNDLIHSHTVKTLATKHQALSDDDDHSEPEVIAEIFFLDWGYRSSLSVSKLRNIREDFLSLPFAAKKCCLWDIFPANESRMWTPQATEVFIKFATKTQMFMKVLEQQNDVFHVDLCQPGINDIKNDVPVSVRDALVFLEFAYLPSPYSDGQIQPSQRHFLPPPSLHEGECIDVVLTHIESPELFYVQQVGRNAFGTLFFDIQEKYSKESSSLSMIYSPHVGMACVAQYAMDKQWYRAVVKELPGGAMVRVRYVDFGNEETLPYWRLRKISDNFLEVPMQALCCGLDSVIPMQGTKWSKEANDAFTHLAGKKQLKMTVKKCTPEKAFVSLVEVKDSCSEEVSVAKLLADLHHARTITDNGAAVMGKGASSQTLQSGRDGPLGIILQKLKDVKQGRSQDNADGKNFVIFPVAVSFFDSPSSFYVQLLMPQFVSCLENTMCNLQKICEEKEPTCAHNWTKGSLCAILNSNDEKWYRGKVAEYDSKNNTATVLFIDYGGLKVLPEKKLHPLNKEFTFEPLAIQCHLAGIVPAGSGKGWTRVAKEQVQEAIAPDAADMFIVVKDEPDADGSLPVDLLLETVHEGGALEPRTIHHEGITQKLLDLGLALPKAKGRCCTTSISEIEPILKISRQQRIKNRQKQLEEMPPIPSVRTLWTPPQSHASTSKPKNKAKMKRDDKKTKVIATSLSAPEAKRVLPKVAKTEPVNGIRQAQSRSSCFHWLSPASPDSMLLQVIPTHVDHYGNIFFHVSEPGSHVIGLIRDAIQQKLEGGMLKPFKGIVRIGQACIAKFWYDDSWYRGEVVKVFPGRAEIFFVDYGNTELVGFEDISVDLVMEEVPRQCMKGKMCKVKPISGDGRWPSKVLDYIQEVVVDKLCTVCVVDRSEDCLQIALILPDGMPLNKLLVSKNMAFDLDSEGASGLLQDLQNQALEIIASYNNSSKNADVALPVFQSSSPKCFIDISSDLTKKCLKTSQNNVLEDVSSISNCDTRANPIPLPLTYSEFVDVSSFETGDVLPAVVTCVLHPDLVYLQLLRISSPCKPLHCTINSRFDDFVAMMDRLRKEADKFQPFLRDSVCVGSVFCGKYQLDEGWYRCQVQEIVDGGVGYKSIFVDYGNTEVLKNDEMRVLPEVYARYPKQAILCRLHGVYPAKGKWSTSDVNRMEQCLLNEGQPLWALIQDTGPPLRVSFYADRDTARVSASVIYKPLADEGIIILCEDY